MPCLQTLLRRSLLSAARRKIQILLLFGVSPGAVQTPHWGVIPLHVQINWAGKLLHLPFECCLSVSPAAVLVAGSSFLTHASKTLLLLYLMLFCASEIAFGLLLSTLFSRAKVGASGFM